MKVIRTGSVLLSYYIIICAGELGGDGGPRARWEEPEQEASHLRVRRVAAGRGGAVACRSARWGASSEVCSASPDAAALAGIYSCVAWNRQGADTRSVSVSVGRGREQNRPGNLSAAVSPPPPPLLLAAKVRASFRPRVRVPR